MKQRIWRCAIHASFPDRPYAGLCANIARHQNCSEFEIFKAAYSQWYGKPVSERDIERVFVRFIFYHETPFWVRQYLQNEYRSAPDDEASRRRATPYSECWIWLRQMLGHRFEASSPPSSSVLVA